MKTAISLAFAALLLSSIQGRAAEQSIKVYGPGGPQGPMQECAERFGNERSVKVEVVAGPEKKWIEQARQDADVFFGGAEYMLAQFIEKHPDLVDAAEPLRAALSRVAPLFPLPTCNFIHARGSVGYDMKTKNTGHVVVGMVLLASRSLFGIEKGGGSCRR